MDKSKTGLLVIDMQDKLVAAMNDSDRVVRKVVQAIGVARALGLPIIVSEHRPEKLGPTISAVKEALGDFSPVVKTEFSASGVVPDDVPKNLLVCGLETHVCVRQTVYDLRGRQKTIYVLGDAVSSRSVLDHQIALDEFTRDRILITSVEATAFEMLEKAEGDLFKKILALVK